MAELERKAKEKKKTEENLCPLCGKDIRFFCEVCACPAVAADLVPRTRAKASPADSLPLACPSPPPLPQCRANDKDYERPLPEGWKKSELGFTDNYDKYATDGAQQLKPRPPSPPRPYQGRVGPKCVASTCDGSARWFGVVLGEVLCAAGSLLTLVRRSLLAGTGSTAGRARSRTATGR